MITAIVVTGESELVNVLNPIYEEDADGKRTLKGDGKEIPSTLFKTVITAINDAKDSALDKNQLYLNLEKFKKLTDMRRLLVSMIDKEKDQQLKNLQASVKTETQLKSIGSSLFTAGKPLAYENYRSIEEDDLKKQLLANSNNDSLKIAYLGEKIKSFGLALSLVDYQTINSLQEKLNGEIDTFQKTHFGEREMSTPDLQMIFSEPSEQILDQIESYKGNQIKIMKLQELLNLAEEINLPVEDVPATK
jgi:hypothetical protein